MIAAEARARAVLDRLPDGPVEGAEVGVYDGRMSAFLLARPDLTLHMVDRWKAAPDGPYRDTGDPRALLDDRAMLVAFYRAREATAFADGRRTLHMGESVRVAEGFGPLDFVFIDADHSYEGVRADIGAWLPTLKPGGLIGGHDYGDPAFPGVQRAVDEACARFGWTLDLGDDRTWFARC